MAGGEIQMLSCGSRQYSDVCQKKMPYVDPRLGFDQKDNVDMGDFMKKLSKEMQYDNKPNTESHF